MKRFSLILTLLVTVACGKQADNVADDDNGSLPEQEIMSLELPAIPEAISTMEGKAGYLAGHFWDNLNFTDTLRSLNVDFMEQNFVDFLSLLPAVMSSDRAVAFDRMLKQASASHDAYWLMVDMGDKYLMDPNSPLRNEDYYIDFLNSVLGDTVISPVERERYEYFLREANKVRPGSPAPDFKYVTRAGKKSSLRQTLGKPLVLVFTAPQCDNCKGIIDFVSAHPSVAGPLESGEIQVLAIYPETDRNAWNKPLHKLPAAWIDAIVTQEGVDSLYPIPAYPAIYLINPNGTIRLKDATPEVLIEAL
ncbi:MAG: DUF5106 domain-containing protein [Muribaculaceae bacterium]|nr:DUF5106 domain-containing protein [Muribaculaceae bacterium]